jgi:hypothetical protein
MSTKDIAGIAGVDDWEFDPWGSALGLHFAICDVLHAIGESGDALARWEFRPSPFAVADTLPGLIESEDYSVSALAESVIDGVISVEDLVRAGEVLSRYTALAVLAGRDY